MDGSIGAPEVTERKPHIAIDINSLDASLPFYSALFGMQPDKLKSDYARFTSANPPVVVSLMERDSEITRDGHFGIQVKSSADVRAFYERLETLGIDVKTTEKEVACCYSVQDKLWAVDPDGNHWEVFVVTDKDDNAACSSNCDCICYDPATGGCSWG
ncbi:MAG: ArsI/CadI family heavy metal resistance metalloenzyme [Azospirillaceae bacterium]